MDTSKGKEEIYKVDTTNYKKSAGHEEEEPQKEDVKITHVPLTYEKRETGDSLAAKLAEKIESAKETVTGADADEHNKKD
uniref:Putative ovule protein n=1 Tax=Solanum chacoense TaxID=4108 RepID=A0A0V0GHW7_SOLCH